MSRLSFVRLITCLYTATLIAIVVGSGLGLCDSLRSFALQYASDKVLHFVLIGTLAFLLNLSLRLRTVGGVRHRLCQQGTSLMLFVATAEEFSQAFIPARDFQWLDLGSNYLGVTLLGSAALLFAFAIRDGDKSRRESASRSLQST